MVQWYGYDCSCSCIPAPITRGLVDVGYGMYSLEQALLDYRHEVKCILYPDESCDVTDTNGANIWSNASSWDDDDDDFGSWQPEPPAVLPPASFALSVRPLQHARADFHHNMPSTQRTRQVLPL